MLKSRPVVKIVGLYFFSRSSAFIAPKRESRIPIIITAVYLMSSTGIVYVKFSPMIIPMRMPTSA